MPRSFPNDPIASNLVLMTMGEEPLDWRRTWAELELPVPRALQADLLKRWSEPWRHYHDLRHLSDCLSLFAGLRDLSRRPAEIELALWFHDAILDSRSDDNEERSAGLARSLLPATGLSLEATDRIARLVLATRHRGEPPRDEAALLVGIDLAILGADEARFAQYEGDIRAEYDWVPEPEYRRARTEVLRRFLAQEAIFVQPRLRAELEDRARRNIARLIGELESPAGPEEAEPSG